MLNSHGVFYRTFALYSAFLLFLIVVLTAGGTYPEKENCKNRKGWLTLKKPCLIKGGICVRADRCPKEERETGKGLCPNAESSGIVCCHKVSFMEMACKQHGGECMKDCGKAKNFGKQNCKEGKTCCLLEL